MLADLCTPLPVHGSVAAHRHIQHRKTAVQQDAEIGLSEIGPEEAGSCDSLARLN